MELGGKVLGEPEVTKELAIEVTREFVVFSPERFLARLDSFAKGELFYAKSFSSAIDGLRSVTQAANLPFELIQDSVSQHRFIHFHMAARIRSLGDKEPNSNLTREDEKRALDVANEQMESFLNEDVGRDFIRDKTILEMWRRLQSDTLRGALQELLIQTLISTWSIFESFARSFIVDYLNSYPSFAGRVLASSDFREAFGKPSIDIEIIGHHGFDLSRSMGDILFRGRHLDNLHMIKSMLKVILDSAEVQSAIGKDMSILNQRRHLFVHRRGVVDVDYLEKTGDIARLGERLVLTSDDIEAYLLAVGKTMMAIGEAVVKKQPDL